MYRNDLVFGIGPAGTGKTFLAVVYAAKQLRKGNVKRYLARYLIHHIMVSNTDQLSLLNHQVKILMIHPLQLPDVVLTRPAVEAGESLGFLPGDLKEKVDPYLRPLYDGHKCIV
jgi:phosphate starvation-inducible PhoH-like protein